MALPSPVVRLVQFTDPHLFTRAEGQMRSRNTRDSFTRTLEYALPFVNAADAILLTGDIAQDELGSTYAVVRELMIPLGKPIWCLPGNHDNPVEMSHRLDRAPFVYLGAHAVHNWEVILLNSHLAGAAAGTLGDDEIKRLGDHCKDSSAAHLLVVLHHHPISIGSRWLDTVGLLDRAACQRIMHISGKVRGVCFGHVHQAADIYRDEIRYMSCPSTCSQFAPGSEDFALDDKPPGFRWIELLADGEIRSDAMWLND